MRRLILAAALVAALQSAAFARTAMETNQLVDDSGVPIGTAGNPLFIAGSSNPTGLTAAAAIVALPANTATPLSVSGLKRFAVQVQGAGRVQIGFDSTVCTTGYRLDPPGSATGQAAVQTWYPANGAAYWGCAPDVASSVFVERGQ